MLPSLKVIVRSAPFLALIFLSICSVAKAGEQLPRGVACLLDEIDTKSSAPQITTHRAIVTMLISGCLTSRRRGSVGMARSV